MSLTQLMYRQMLTGNKAFKELFRALEAGETPILFHCTAGKDRTGVAAMLILLALGASDETICADYARTNLCRAAEIEKAMADHAAEIAADPAQRMRWQTSAGVDPETAPFVLRTIRQDYGSAESYLEAEYGLTPRPPDAAAADVSGMRRFGMRAALLCAYSAEKLFVICKSGKSADFPDLLFHGGGVWNEPPQSPAAPAPPRGRLMAMPQSFPPLLKPSP